MCGGARTLAALRYILSLELNGEMSDEDKATDRWETEGGRVLVVPVKGMNTRNSSHKPAL